MIPKREQEYKVAARSATTNAFGLRGFVLVDRWGESWEVAFNNLNAPGVIGDSILVPYVNGSPVWSRVGGEIPRPKFSAPEKLVRKLWQRRAYRTPYVLELEHNGDPYGAGFIAHESLDDGRTWFYRGDWGAQTRTWWRAYARRNGYRLREATGQYKGSRKGAA